MKSGKVDTFGKFVEEIIKKEQLIKDISNKIVFIGEYQNLLFEHIVLDISYVLLDKMDDKSRMQIEIEKVQDKLHNDIKNGKADINYTQEIELLRKSGDYDMRLWEIEKRFYKDNLDFWHSEIKPQMIARGIVNE